MLYSGVYGCDDNNSNNDDGCNEICEVEEGWTCVNDAVLTYDVCTEICGDGLDFFNYPCDDGNLIPGDGCDATCQIEVGWACGGGNYPWADTCYFLDPCLPSSVDKGNKACVDWNNANLDWLVNLNFYINCYVGVMTIVKWRRDGNALKVVSLQKIHALKCVEMVGIWASMHVMIGMLIILLLEIT